MRRFATRKGASLCQLHHGVQLWQRADCVSLSTAPSAEARDAERGAQRYRRRSSNPGTLRERVDFQRDYKYSKRRPLLDVPWCQHKHRTYLDDAERLYGRKETWHLIKDKVTREKLVALMRDYLRDMASATRIEVRDAIRYRAMCERARQEYRQHLITGGYVNAQSLRDWAAQLLQPRKRTDSTATAPPRATPTETSPETPAVHASAPVAETDARTMTRLHARRRRGAETDVSHTVAVADLPEGEARRQPAASAFPFLRQRALTQEDTLDPSLVDWTAKYYPDDDADTFAQPPQLRHDHTAAPQEADGDVTGGAAPIVTTHTAAAEDAAAETRPRLHARHRLRRSLSEHDNRYRATFDADGVFYRVRRQTEDDERAPTPRPMRGADVSDARSREVVKVPWDVAATARRQGYSTDILRAKERLIRLTRGENPESIP